MPIPTAADLTLRAERGDDEARSILIRRHLGQVWGLALFHVGDPVRAAAITREILAKALSDLGRVPDPRKLRAWIQRIALRKIRESTGADRPRGADGGRLAAGGEASLQKIQALPEELRRSLVMRYFEGLSYSKIASRVGSSRDRVDQLLQRAKEQVRRSPGPG